MASLAGGVPSTAIGSVQPTAAESAGTASTAHLSTKTESPAAEETSSETLFPGNHKQTVAPLSDPPNTLSHPVSITPQSKPQRVTATPTPVTSSSSHSMVNKTEPDTSHSSAVPAQKTSAKDAEKGSDPERLWDEGPTRPDFMRRMPTPSRFQVMWKTFRKAVHMPSAPSESMALETMTNASSIRHGITPTNVTSPRRGPTTDPNARSPHLDADGAGSKSSVSKRLSGFHRKGQSPATNENIQRRVRTDQQVVFDDDVQEEEDPVDSIIVENQTVWLRQQAPEGHDLSQEDLTGHGMLESSTRGHQAESHHVHDNASTVAGRTNTSSVTGRNSVRYSVGTRNPGQFGHAMSEDNRSTFTSNFITESVGFRFARDTIWPSLLYFCRSNFRDPDKELTFQRDSWFVLKPVAICASIFFIGSWILTASLSSTPNLYHIMTYIVVFGITVLPVLPLVVFDAPRRRPWIYQIFLFVATWTFIAMHTANIRRCGFYGPPELNTCGGIDFTALLLYATAFPTLSLLTLGQWRGLFITGATAYSLVLAITVIPVRYKWYRNVIIFIFYSVFIVILHYLRENSDRRMFTLRDQLKTQYRATQKAQIAERKSADAKRAFTSYLFHEVRVPLNTCLLAVQNLEGEGAFSNANAAEREMLDGLLSSLSIIERVLNDVLDFGRMEAGRFVSVSKPFELHKSFRSTLLSHRTVAASAGLTLETELSPRIDDEFPILSGDEMRLRQILSNLVSNSIKFTNVGGRVIIRTKLLYPREEEQSAVTAEPEALKAQHETQMDQSYSNIKRLLPKHQGKPPRKDVVIVRIEVEDTGLGIKQSDLDGGALFSPYAQTEIGRRQGGKGSGLGLALVKQIIQLSQGRMGIISQFGVGTMMWLEIMLDIPPPSPKVTSVMSPVVASQRPVPELLTSYHSAPSASPMPPLLLRTSTSETIPTTKSGSDSSLQSPNRASTQRTTSYNSQPPLAEALNFNANADAYNNSPFLQSAGRPEKPASGFNPTGKGTTSTAENSSSAMKRSNLSAGPALNVLVVDDDRLTRMLMTRMLGRLGMLVSLAENGQIGLDLVQSSLTDAADGLKNSSFDIIFLDNQMPKMTGVELIRAARRSGYRGFAVGISGNALVDDQKEFKDAGLDKMLTKPVREASIIETIELARKRINSKKQ